MELSVCFKKSLIIFRNKLRKHVKIYIDYFGYGDQDIIIDEWTGGIASDIHHLDNKGMGGSKNKDYIENLMALSRETHNKAHSNPEFNQRLTEYHLEFMKTRTPYEI